MLVRDYVIAIVLFGIIVGIGALIVVDMAGTDTGYGVENMTNPSFQDRYDTLTESAKDIHSMQNATSSGSLMQAISPYTSMFKATISIIKIVFDSFGMVITTINNILEDIGVPSELANLAGGGIILIIIATVIFIIVSSVSRGRL